MQLAVGEAARGKVAAAAAAAAAAADALSLTSGCAPAAGLAVIAAAPAAQPEQADAALDEAPGAPQPLTDHHLALASARGAGAVAGLPAGAPLLRQLHSLQSVLGLFHLQEQQRPAASAASLLATGSQHPPLLLARRCQEAAATEDPAASSSEPPLSLLLLRSSPSSLELSRDGHRLDLPVVDHPGGGGGEAVSPSVAANLHRHPPHSGGLC